VDDQYERVALHLYADSIQTVLPGAGAVIGFTERGVSVKRHASFLIVAGQLMVRADSNIDNTIYYFEYLHD
jgi:hypothetical protein